MKKSIKSAGLLLFLILLVALAIRLALTALEVKSLPAGDPNAQIRKVEREMKQVAEKKTQEIEKAKEAEDSTPPPSE